jgi:hypothetical protein
MRLTRDHGGILLLAVIAYILFRSIQGFQKIAWGTGVWWGEYSLKWGAAYTLYILFCTTILVLAGVFFWRPEKLQPAFHKLASFRERLGTLRWMLALLVAILPIWILQYTPWGVVFRDIHIRLLMWALVVFIFALLVTKESGWPGWHEHLSAILLTSGLFVIAVPFMNLTSYPFSLGWSEGNRMWDFSILFGRHLYDYPADQEIPVLLDIGRQFVGGIPFLIPGLTIEMERFWLASMLSIPYLMLGAAAFSFTRSDWRVWLLAALWTLIFLKQGPIHPPLILCAVATALLWKRPLWLAIPLIAVTGYFAEQSRFTWVFAPGIWIGMLELVGASLVNNKLAARSWVRAVSLGLAGLAGGQYGNALARSISNALSAAATAAPQAAPAATPLSVAPATSVSSAVNMFTDPVQPLLWYRLFPNETYGPGILLGLLFAIAPLIIMLAYLVKTRKWELNIWQSLAVFGPLLAFFVVGLIVSTKIGGGGDLHNMDMFLIALLFLSVIAWQNGGADWFSKIQLAPVWVKVVMVLLFILPGLHSLSYMRSHHFAEEAKWLLALTDVQEQRFLEMYPTREMSDEALTVIQEQVDLALAQDGEVLFMDQRQLLTFHLIQNVPLVPEYEKKILMNEALASRRSYFEPFYGDLESHRFSLIVTEILRTPIKDSTYRFGEENNAWVQWVSTPVLCYYEPKVTLRDVGVQLLVPKSEPVDCSDQLPWAELE